MLLNYWSILAQIHSFVVYSWLLEFWNLKFPVYVQVRVKSYVDGLSYHTKVSNAAESSNRKGMNAILSCEQRMSLFKTVSVL